MAGDREFFGSFFLKRTSCCAGFTLIETLIALTIVATGFAFAFIAMPAGLAAQDSARNLDTATTLAQSLLDQADTAAAQGTQAGMDWHIATTPLSSARPSPDFGGRLIQVTLTWPEHGQARHLAVETIRLGALAPSP